MPGDGELWGGLRKKGLFPVRKAAPMKGAALHARERQPGIVLGLVVSLI
jgi:hypothetical protein